MHTKDRVNSQNTIIAALTIAVILVTSASVTGLSQTAFAASTTSTQIVNDGVMTIDEVKMLGTKTKSTRGIAIVSLVQDGDEIAKDKIKIKNRSTALTLKADFDGTKVTGDFEIEVAFIGRGTINLDSTLVNGQPIGNNEDNDDGGDDDSTPPPPPPPTPDEDDNTPPPPPTPDEDDNNPPPSATSTLTVQAKNADNLAEEIAGMWIAILQESALVDSGHTAKSFELNNGQSYSVYMDDYSDGTTTWEFVGWQGNPAGKLRSFTMTEDQTFTALFRIESANSPPDEDDSTPPPPPPPPTTTLPPSDPGSITAYANRIPSSHWGPSFTSANAQMYFVLYNSTGWMVTGDYYDENGTTVSGLVDGEQYYIYATNCHHCHGGTHDVAFHHWENGSTENPRGLTTTMSVGAYYEYVPDTP